MIKKTRFIIVYVLLIITALYINLHATISVPPTKPLRDFPVLQNGWKMRSQATFSENILNVLQPTDYLSRVYLNDEGDSVDLYIGYHGGGKDSGGIHSPRHCLPGSGWFGISEETLQLDAGPKKINIVKAVYQKGENREMFLYWFQVKDRTLTDEYALKAAEILNSIMNNRTDDSFIRISVPFTNDEEKAYLMGKKFIIDFYQVIDEFLPK